VSFIRSSSLASQAVYSDAAATCSEHDLVFPGVRPIEQLRAGDISVQCPRCGAQTTTVPTPEGAHIGGETVYGLTKVDQERLVLIWGRQARNPYCRLATRVHLRSAANLSSIRTQALSQSFAHAC
jgi:hypothetical protein